MMYSFTKKALSLLTMMVLFISGYSQTSGLIITEISYNPPESGTDSLEFIEFKNVGSTSIDLTGYSFSLGVVHSFTGGTIAPNSYYVIAVNSSAMLNTFGVTVDQWTSGGLSNGGESILLLNANGDTAAFVQYDDIAPWPISADGSGPSLVFCDSSLTNNDGANWLASTTFATTNANGDTIFASPMAADAACSGGSVTPPSSTTVPMYNIAIVNTEDTAGVADSLNVNCAVKGIVTTIDFDGNAGYSFYMQDLTGGINVYSGSDLAAGTQFTQGDSVIIYGSIAQFNGLVEIIPDSATLLNTGNALPTPTVVTSFDNNNEGLYVKIENLEVTNVGSGTSFNVDVTDGTNTFQIRVDSDTDVDDNITFNVGDSICSVIGAIGQYDSSNPYTSGFQIFPSFAADVDTTCGGGAVTPPTTSVPMYDIAIVNTEDTAGVADSLNVVCAVKGIVTTIDFDGNAGYSFYMQDLTGGINVYSSSDLASGTQFTQGDSVIIYGTILQFNGLVEITPDSAMVLNSGNTLPTPTVVTSFDNNNEGLYVTIENLEITNVGTGSSGFNVSVTDGTTNFTIRVDVDSDVDDNITFNVGDSLCSVVGAIGQFDSSNPYTSGFQIFPSFAADVDTTCGGGTVTPPTTSVPMYPIGTINTEDVDGVADSLGVNCAIKGIVTTIDFDGNAGYSFYMQDLTGGINVYSGADLTSGLQFTQGDSIIIYGSILQFNGLVEITPDSAMVLNSGNTLPTPTVVTSFDNNNEGLYVTIENLEITNVGTGSSGFNVDVTDGTNSFQFRVDADTDINGILSFTVGDSLCSITGAIGQFDNSSPYTSGFQLMPSFAADFDTTCGGTVTPPVVVIPTYPIELVRTVDADGVADSLGIKCRLQGTVVGVDLDGNAGLSFTMVDSTSGINVFNFNDVDNYVVRQGDLILVTGTIDQYNGLIELVPDTIVLLDSNIALPAPMVVTELSEATESMYIKMENMIVVDTALWPTSGNNMNLLITNGTDTVTMRIDKDTEIDEFPAIADTFCITGVGGQFDSGSPFLDPESYQIFPMTINDFDTVGCPQVTPPSSVQQAATNEAQFVVYPNPAQNGVVYFNKKSTVEVFNLLGAKIASVNNANSINLSGVQSGVYLVRTSTGEVSRLVIK